MSRRLRVYLVATFAISWLAWGVLIALVRAGLTAHGRPLFLFLFALGGLGPAVGAYIAVIATRNRKPLYEFHSRLFRWRISPWWYVASIGAPVVLVLGSAALAVLSDPAYLPSLRLRPWYHFVPLFFAMILGGGLEELGWRGVALPSVRRALPVAAMSVGLLWAVWHLPLFYLPGAGQYGTNFALFAVAIMGNALLLAWLYNRTQSILMCVFFHASFNAVMSLGFAASPRSGLPLLLYAIVSLLTGTILLTLFPAVKSP